MSDLDGWIRAQGSRMLAVAADLIRIPSENPPGVSYGDCVARIERECQALGLATARRLDGLVVDASFGTGDSLIYLSGHYDVVPAQSRELFEPRILDGRLYGRGSADMKGGIVAMLYALGALAANRISLSGRVILRCVPDEETGGDRGSAALARTGSIDTNAIGMLTAEPTSGAVWNGSRGALSWRIITRGRAAHVGLMHTGVSAFDGMLAVVDELRSLQNEIAARASLLLIGGRIEGGTNFNVVPERCAMTIDRRTNPDESIVDARAELVACIDRVRSHGVDVVVEVLQEGEPTVPSTDSPLARALSSAIADIAGEPPEFVLCPGLLETRFYSARGVPALAYGPGALELAHGPDESVDVSAMLDCARVYARTILQLLNGS